MHELSIASSLLERAEKTARENDADVIQSLTVGVGTATHVNPDQLEYAFEIIADDSMAADATVSMETIQPEGKCACGWTGEPDPIDGTSMVAPDPICPECGDRITLTAGEEVLLQSVTIPDP